MDFSAYVNKPFNEIFVTFDESLLRTDREELLKHFLTNDCLISAENHKWEKFGANYILRLETKKMAGASQRYNQLLHAYFKLKRRVVKFQADSPQDWLTCIVDEMPK